MPEVLSEEIHIFNTQEDGIRIKWNRRYTEPLNEEYIIPIYKETLEFILSEDEDEEIKGFIYSLK